VPIYEYQCKVCGHEFEAIQRFSDDALIDCPECEKPELKKLISAAGFRLKGAGWYETDFKKGDKKKNLAGDKSVSGSNSTENKSAPASKKDS